MKANRKKNKKKKKNSSNNQPSDSSEIVRPTSNIEKPNQLNIPNNSTETLTQKKKKKNKRKKGQNLPTDTNNNYTTNRSPPDNNKENPENKIILSHDRFVEQKEIQEQKIIETKEINEELKVPLQEEQIQKEFIKEESLKETKEEIQKEPKEIQNEEIKEEIQKEEIQNEEIKKEVREEIQKEEEIKVKGEEIKEKPKEIKKEEIKKEEIKVKGEEIKEKPKEIKKEPKEIQKEETREEIKKEIQKFDYKKKEKEKKDVEIFVRKNLSPNKNISKEKINIEPCVPIEETKLSDPVHTLSNKPFESKPSQLTKPDLKTSVDQLKKKEEIFFDSPLTEKKISSILSSSEKIESDQRNHIFSSPVEERKNNSFEFDSDTNRSTFLFQGNDTIKNDFDFSSDTKIEKNPQFIKESSERDNLLNVRSLLTQSSPSLVKIENESSYSEVKEKIHSLKEYWKTVEQKKNSTFSTNNSEKRWSRTLSNLSNSSLDYRGSIKIGKKPLNLSSDIVTQSAVLLQSLILHFNAKKLFNNEKTRYNIILECTTTEENFSSELKILLQLYIQPTRQNCDFINPEVHKKLFSNAEELLRASIPLVDSLKLTLKNWNFQSSIGKDLLEHLEKFELYREFIVNLDTAFKHYQNLKYDEKFSIWERKLMNDKRVKGKELYDYLVLPFQRLPRWILLIDQLIKYTAPNNPDSEHLKTFVERLKVIASQSDKQKQEREEASKIIEKWHVTDLLPNEDRGFLKEGDLIFDAKPHYILLFTDCIKFTKVANLGNQSKRKWLTLKFTKNFEIFAPISHKSSKKTFPFHLVDENHTYIFEAISLDSFNQWSEKIDYVFQLLRQHEKNIEFSKNSPTSIGAFFSDMTPNLLMTTEQRLKYKEDMILKYEEQQQQNHKRLSLEKRNSVEKSTPERKSSVESDKSKRNSTESDKSKRNSTESEKHECKSSIGSQKSLNPSEKKIDTFQRKTSLSPDLHRKKSPAQLSPRSYSTSSSSEEKKNETTHTELSSYAKAVNFFKRKSHDTTNPIIDLPTIENEKNEKKEIFGQTESVTSSPKKSLWTFEGIFNSKPRKASPKGGTLPRSFGKSNEFK